MKESKLTGKKAMNANNTNNTTNNTGADTSGDAAQTGSVQPNTAQTSAAQTSVQTGAAQTTQDTGSAAVQSGSAEQVQGANPVSEETAGSDAGASSEGEFSYEKYLASLPAISYPLYTTPDGGQHEAEFTYCAIGRVTDVILTKAKSGSKQIWVRGVIVRDVITPTEKMTVEQLAVNPEGFNAFSCRPGPEDGTFEGYRSVIGFPFVYAGTLSEGTGAEMLVNNLRAFGWRGTSFSDFVGKEGKSVLARDLGMDGEIEMHFEYTPAKGNFAGKIQLKKLVPIRASISTTDAQSADAMFEDVIYASLNGRVDGRNKSYEGAAARMKAAMGLSATPGNVIEAPRGPSFKPTQQRTAVGQEKGPGQPRRGTAQNSAQVNQAHCGKPVNGGRACSKAPGHAGACGLTPFG